MIFVKNPVLGKVKTRLAKTIGDAQALHVYQNLLRFTSDVSKPLVQDKQVFYSDFLPKEDILFEDYFFQKAVQQGNDLGERMKNAFKNSFEQGFDSVIIIGSDCPQITTELLQDAFEALKNYPVVLGPATDGGYYLLGMNEYIVQVFENKIWSTATVLEDTLKDLNNLGIDYTLLPMLTDIDEEKDLNLLH